MKTTTDIKCKGIRVHLQGTGRGHIIRGSGDDRKDFYHSQIYANCRRTVWGPIHKTPVVNEAGTDVIYGPPWAPDEGVLEIPLRSPQDVDLIIRVMDYDWCKKDDLLGEVAVNVPAALNRGPLAFPLNRNGKPEHASTVTVAFTMSNPSTIRVQILRANSLKKADWYVGIMWIICEYKC